MVVRPVAHGGPLIFSTHSEVKWSAPGLRRKQKCGFGGDQALQGASVLKPGTTGAGAQAAGVRGSATPAVVGVGAVGVGGGGPGGIGPTGRRRSAEVMKPRQNSAGALPPTIRTMG